ncbi:MAG: IS630 family transposase [Rhodobacteraceae bacterium]|nr:IS630 family transposase [Paracoccaceae bacterium]
MIRANFLSSDERFELERCVRRQREDHGIARRANAILLLDKGKSCAEIAEFLYLDDDTVRGWYKSYRHNGWEDLALDGWQGGQSQMTADQVSELCIWLEDRFCRSASEIRAHIVAQFGLRYSHSGCLKLLHRLGFEYRKPKALPHVANEEKQAEFIAFYESLLNNLPADETVYFADAVHPEHQTKPAFGWVRKGANPAVKTTAGRGRVNIHGALCLENFDAPFVEPVTVDGNSAVQLLTKIEANNPTMTTIHVIWDNAAYHRCATVKKWLARPDCRIHLIQLPAYCPHLNPIERLWAVLHAHVTHNRFYPTQKQFADAVLQFLRQTIPKNWREFRDQVTDNFRVISHQNFRVLA